MNDPSMPPQHPRYRSIFSVHALFFLSVKGKNEKIAIKLTNQYTRLLRNVDIFVVYRKEKER